MNFGELSALGCSTESSGFFNRCPAQRREPWSYAGFNGPLFWGLRYPDCYQRQQSPIDIKTNDVQEDENLEELNLINYDKPLTTARIENNGHSIEITPEDDIARQIMVGEDLYNLHQFHFHWGSNSSKGSEHTIDNKAYAMELHFVHLNQNEDIAVVGVFFEEQDNDNPELQKIVDELPKVQYKGSEAQMESSLNLENLLPSNPTPFYRYMGSLTTPECAEGVTWSVLPEPIPVGSDQMKVFREKLFSTKEEDAQDSCKLVNNFRPVQRLNGRQVSRSSSV